MARFYPCDMNIKHSVLDASEERAGVHTPIRINSVQRMGESPKALFVQIIFLTISLYCLSLRRAYCGVTLGEVCGRITYHPTLRQPPGAYTRNCNHQH